MITKHLVCRPSPSDYPTFARWLVHSIEWGVVSTASLHLDGAPFGNALSYSDGPPGRSTGRLIFYLTCMDATAQDLAANSNATLTICEAQAAGGCPGRVDPQDPTCGKLSITGTMQAVPEEGLEEAQALLFARHPAMRDWPAGHGFQVYELLPTALRLLDAYGGAKDIAPQDYFDADLDRRLQRVV